MSTAKKKTPTEVTSAETNSSLRVTEEQRNALKTIAAMSNRTLFSVVSEALDGYISRELPAALEKVKSSIKPKGARK